MALAPDQKFSTFAVGGDNVAGDIIVGLRGGVNTQFTWTGALPPGYIVPITQGGTGASTASAARGNLGLGTMAVQNADDVDITGGTAALASGQVAAVPVNPTDIANKAYVDSELAGSVVSVSGTQYQILVNDTFGTPEVGVITLTLPQDIDPTSSPTFDVLTLTGGTIYDQYGNVALSMYSPTDLSVNYIQTDTATMGNPPGVYARGTDTNIGLVLAGLGTGPINIYTSALTIPLIINSGSSANHVTNFSFANTTATRTVTFPDASFTVAGTTVALGGTGVSSVTIVPTATAFAGWDANSNLTTNNLIFLGATTVTAGASTSLAVGSKKYQFFTGTTTQTVIMPDVTTLAIYQSWTIINNSTGVVTIESYGGNTITTLTTGASATLICIALTGTTATSWSFTNSGATGVTSITGTASQVIASASTGAVTLSLPQNISTSSSPTFAGLTLGTSVLTLGGSLTTSGAFSTTFTMTAGTSVTFPTSGTLLTSASAVTSLTGTANEILLSGGPTGAIQLSTPQSLATSAAFQVNTLQLNSNNGLLDSSGKELLQYFTNGTPGTAVNFFAIENSPTGVAVRLLALGSDTNVNMQIITQGTGQLLVASTNATQPFQIQSGTAYQHLTTFAFSNTSATDVVTFPDASFTIAGTTLALGGTGGALTASNGGIVYSGSSTLAILAGTATAGQLLTSGSSTTPAWSTSTYPLTNAVNTLLWASSANVMAALATANSSVLQTSSGGVPSWSTTLPSGLSATNLTLVTPSLGAATATSVVLTKVNGSESSNAVTASGSAGVITTSSLSTAGGGSYAITWTNTSMTTTSGISLCIVGGTNTTENITLKCAPGSGTATLTIYNNTAATALNGTILLSYRLF